MLFKDFAQLAPPKSLEPAVLPPTATGAPQPPPAAVATTPAHVPGKAP
jgi:hypothetical protein